MGAQGGLATRHADEPAVQVRLDLAQRGGAGSLGAVGVGQGAVGVLPALVARAGAAIVDPAVSVCIADILAPGQRSLRHRPHLLEQGVVARPVVRVRERDQEECGGVNSPEEDVRPAAEVDGIAGSDLVKNLARLFLRLRVVDLALVQGEKSQRALRDARVHG